MGAAIQGDASASPAKRAYVRKAPAPEPEDTMTVAEVAGALDVPDGILTLWRDMGRGPPFVRQGREVAYSRRGFERWLADRRAFRSAEEPEDPTADDTGAGLDMSAFAPETDPALVAWLRKSSTAGKATRH
jgi:hypothetical protein